MLRHWIISFLVAVIFFTSVRQGYAKPYDDGFSSAQTIQTRYFTVSLAAGVDNLVLMRSLDIPPSHKVLAGQSLSGVTYAPDDLGDLLDALFAWASNVLDMQLFSYKGNIKVTRNAEQLKSVYRSLYGVENRAEKAFYIYEMNTVYISQDNFTKEILGHEIGHAIINNFFVVQPPAKVQEVLAGYIEYQLRKPVAR